MLLENLGATLHLRQLIEQHAQPGMELGRVCFASHEEYKLYLDSGEYVATPSGRLRWDDTLPVVGDWVAARKLDQTMALIEDVLPRRTQFSRTRPGSGLREQVIAANIDLAVIVSGLDWDFNLRRLERYLVSARESGADAVIVLNKTDICSDPDEKQKAVEEVAGSGIPILLLSSWHSVAALQRFTIGKTIALLGSSGAGKSTIANRLLGTGQQETSPVREQDSRGRHTTTARTLIPLPYGGALIDTPGMRELELWAGESSLEEVFPEIKALAQQCYFADCSHKHEPECAVQAALADGQLNQARWQSYQKLMAELKYQVRSQDVKVMNAEKKKWKVIHKAMRHHPKYNR